MTTNREYNKNIFWSAAIGLLAFLLTIGLCWWSAQASITQSLTSSVVSSVTSSIIGESEQESVVTATGDKMILPNGNTCTVNGKYARLP